LLLVQWRKKDKAHFTSSVIICLMLVIREDLFNVSPAEEYLKR